MAVNRIKREMNKISEDSHRNQYGVRITLYNDQNWLDLRGEIDGPPGTPYNGGRFQLEIIIPDTYPLDPPKIKFLTKIWHPNISSVTGAVCDILKDSWAPSMTLRTVLLSLQALLSDPEPDEPQDAVVAKQYKESHATFVSTAEHWTAVYAEGPNLVDNYEKDVQKMKDMGINEMVARARLSQSNWNFQAAVNLFLQEVSLEARRQSE